MENQPGKKRHAPAEEMRRDLEDLISRINALEVVASGEYQKGAAKVLRALVEYQIHSLNEFEHLKKAMDLLMQQIFRVENEARDNLTAG